VLEAVPTASMLSSVVPLLMLGTFALYQSRKQNTKPEVRDLSEMEVLAEDRGFDSERLRLLQSWAMQLIASKHIPGVVIAVARRGVLLFHEAYGDSAYSKDSIMGIQSVAMPIITAAFLSLVDEGMASIDDEVTKFLPYFAKFRVYRSGSTGAFLTDPVVTKMTMRHLLTNTWGFPSVLPTASRDPGIRLLDSLAAAAIPVIGSDTDFEKLTDIPLIDQPGRRYRVSLAASVVGHIICKITGRSLREVVFDRILGPLGMLDTDWCVPAEKRHRITDPARAAPWLTNRLWGNLLTGEHAGHTSWLGWVAKPFPRPVPKEPPSEVDEWTDMFSTALDQIRFHAMLLGGGVDTTGKRILSQASVRLMTTNQLPGRGLDDASFNSHARDRGGSAGLVAPQFGVGAPGQGVGLGTQVVTRPFTSRLAGSKGSFSAWGHGGAECWSDPALGLTVFVGAQLFPSWALPDLRQQVAGHIYGSLVSTAAAKHLAGGTGDDSAGGMMSSIMNGMLMMSMMGGAMGGMGGMGGATGAGAAGGGGGGGAGAAGGGVATAS